MFPKSRFDNHKISLFANAVVVVGLLLLLFSLSQKYFIKYNNQTPSIIYASPLKERELAQRAALRQGKKEYSFESSFLPGIGYIGDGKAFQQQQLDELKKTIPVK